MKNSYNELTKKVGALITAGAISLTLSGCDDREVSTNNSNNTQSVIDTTNSDSLENGVQQILDIPGENFKLKVGYQCVLNDGEKWTVTSDKSIFMEISTLGLPEDMKVYIDNIHTDTTICSHYPQINGIMQDSMDDRIHNSLMYGFSISDTNSFYGINQIDGQNDTFIKGFTYGYNGYTSGSISEQRFLESDYLKKGVYANNISSIIDLIVVKGEEISFTSVKSEVTVSVWPYIELKNANGESYYKYYHLNEQGKIEVLELTEEEFIIQTQIDSNKLTRKK